jgi:hypothetical protein
MPSVEDEEDLCFRHGHPIYRNQTRVYGIWRGMRSRCENPRNRSYPRYGGRGIKVCERWAVFENFLADMGEPPTPQHQIERQKNGEGYYPENCHWATPKEQANNRRSSRLLTYQGRTQTLQAWCDELGLKHNTVVMRLNEYGWSVERALSTPARNWSPGRKRSE